jgi:hypothetical protein
MNEGAIAVLTARYMCAADGSHNVGTTEMPPWMTAQQL